MKNINLIFIQITIFVVFLLLFLLICQVSGQWNNLLATDFIGIYTGPYMLSKGAVSQLYQLDSQYLYQQQFSPQLTSMKNLMVFLYPPYIAFLLTPITLISFRSAYIIWGIINILLLILIIIYVNKIIFRSINKEKIKNINLYFIYFLILISPPIWVSILQGQFTIILLAIFIYSWQLLKQNKSFQAGLILSLLLIRPHILLIPLILFLYKKDLQVIKGIFGGSLIFFIGTIMLFGLSGFFNYIQFLSQILFLGNNNRTLLQFGFTIRGLLQYLAKTNDITVIFVTLILINLFITYSLLKVWRGKFSYQELSFDLKWGIMLIGIILTSFHINYHDLSFIIISGLILIIYQLSKAGLKQIIKIKNMVPVIFMVIFLSQFILSWLFVYPFINTLLILIFYIYYLKLLNRQKYISN